MEARQADAAGYISLPFRRDFHLGRYRGQRRRFAEKHFPSYLEGLSLRAARPRRYPRFTAGFPFLFGGTFIEGSWRVP